MLTYSFTNIGSDSLYHHLYQCIREDILCGNLTAETKLPSKRSFAKNLGVSNITVENAYAQLHAEGYIYSIPKKGFYVRYLSALTLSKSQTTSSTSNSLRMPDKYKVDLASNQMNPEQFPFSVWSKLIRETLLNRHVELMQTPPWGGVWDLRHAICSQLKDFRGMDVTPEQIIIGAGTEYLYGLLIQLFGQDKVYAVENPGYHKIAKIYENSRVKYRYIPISAKGIDALELESSGAQIVHLSPSHHFPTGIVTPIGTRYELLAWATRQPGRYIIEDDYDSEFRLSGKPIPTLQSIDQSERVIYMNTFTKSLSSTIRISYMVLPKHLLEQFAKRLSFYSCTVSNFEQYTLARFIEDRYFEKHINRMRTYYRKIRDELLDAIANSALAAHCNIAEEDSGLHFLLHIDTSLPDDALSAKAKEYGLHLSFLSEYYEKGSPNIPAHTLIINYSGLTSEKIPQVITLLSKCILT